MTLPDRPPAHTCTRCGLPTHNRGSRCTDCYLPYAQETAMPAQRSRTLTRPGSTDEREKGADWRAEAACKDADPELFFEPSQREGWRENGAERKARITDALSYCDRCPVIAQCRADALATRDDWGILGGLTAEQRHDLTRGQRKRRSVA